MSKKKPKIDLDAALDDLFRWMNRPVTDAEWEEFTSWRDEMARTQGDKPPPPPGPGRPRAGGYRYLVGDDRISASYRAARDVVLHLKEFRRRHGRRVPKGVTKRVINEVLSYTKKADEVLVAEYLRDKRKYFPELHGDDDEVLTSIPAKLF